MSLDVYLTMKKKNADKIKISSKASSPHIFIREDGQTREISRKEWDNRFPGREPVTVNVPEDENDDVFQSNITHNLIEMASEAGIYKCIWRPDEINITKGQQLLLPLRNGLELLKSDPERFLKFNPENGWGSYDLLIKFIENYSKACENNPDADVSVWR